MATLKTNMNEFSGLMPNTDNKVRKAPGLVDGLNVRLTLRALESAYGHELAVYAPPFADAAYGTMLGGLLFYDRVVMEAATGRIIFEFPSSLLGQRGRWTSAYIGGVTYYARNGRGLWSHDAVGNVWKLIDASVVACTSCAGRLIAVSEDAIMVSSFDDGSDIGTTDPDTGASVTSTILAGRGEVIGLVSVYDSFFVFTRTGLINARGSDALVPFRYFGTLGTRYSPLNSLCIAQLEEYSHVILTEAGLMVVTPESALPVVFESDMGEHLLRRIRQGQEVALTYAAERQELFVHIQDVLNAVGQFTGAYTFYIPSKKWGVFSTAHYAVSGIGFLDSRGQYCKWSAAQRNLTRNPAITHEVPITPTFASWYSYEGATRVLNVNDAAVSADYPSRNPLGVIIGLGRTIEPTVQAPPLPPNRYYENGVIAFSEIAPVAVEPVPSDCYAFSNPMQAPSSNAAVTESYAEVDELPVLPPADFTTWSFGEVPVDAALPFSWPSSTVEILSSAPPSAVAELATTTTVNDAAIEISSVAVDSIEDEEVTSEDWNLLSGESDWNAENGDEDWNVDTLYASVAYDGFASASNGWSLLSVAMSGISTGAATDSLLTIAYSTASAGDRAVMGNEECYDYITTGSNSHWGLTEGQSMAISGERFEQGLLCAYSWAVGSDEGEQGLLQAYSHAWAVCPIVLDILSNDSIIGSALPSAATIGPWRFTDEANVDRLGQLSNVLIGSEPFGSEVIAEDWNLLSGEEDWNLLDGEEDWGLSSLPGIRYSLTSLGTVDGQTVWSTQLQTPALVLDSGSAQLYACTTNGIFHLLSMQAAAIEQSINLNFVELSGILSGRL